jgi:hypothetical protein
MESFYKMDIESKAMSDRALLMTTEKIVNLAVESARRRNSKVIREIDVKAAISMFSAPKTPKWYIIPVAGNGACLCKFLFLYPCAAHTFSRFISNPLPLQLRACGFAWR